MNKLTRASGIRTRGLRLFVFLLSVTATLAGRPPAPRVHWVRFEQLDSLQKEQPRPVFIYLHTSWCGYCQLFGRTTLRNAEVVKRLNDGFYSVDFDAESHQPVTYRGHTYRFQPTGVGTGQHQLAMSLTKPYTDTAYPGLLFRDWTFQPLTAVFSALARGQFLPLLEAVSTSGKKVKG